MICPECGTRNADGEALCVECGKTLAPAKSEQAATANPTSVLTSLLALASLVLAIVGSIGIILIIFLCLLEYPFKVFLLDLGGLGVPCVWYPILYLLPVLLGVVARRRIAAMPERPAGLGLARAGVILGTLNIVLGFVLHVAAVFGTFPGPPLDGQPTWVTRVRIKMRSLATAVEAYFAEHSMYPAWGIGTDGPGGTWTYNYSLAPYTEADLTRRTWHYKRRERGRFSWYEKTPHRSNHPADLPSFLLNGPAPGQGFATLTTPIAYIQVRNNRPGVPSYPVDPFSPIRGATFAYWSVFPDQKDPSGRIVGKDSPVSGVGWILVSAGPDRRYDILPDNWDVYDAGVEQPSKRLLAGTNKEGRAYTYDPTNGVISSGDIWRVRQ